MNNDLGDRMKAYESLTGTRLVPLLPAIIRIDGRAFHTFTRGLRRPYDERLSSLMTTTTARLVEEFDALVGYTQSDEISLLWHQNSYKSELPFAGRTQKMVSNIASFAAAVFNRLLPDNLPEKSASLPTFDARVFSLPNKEEAANYFLWRVRDAEKNSIQMAAQHHFPHKRLHGLHGSAQQELLFQEAGVNWNNYPPFFKRGTFVRRNKTTVPFTVAEIEGLPAKHHARINPGLVVERRTVSAIETPPFSRMANQVGFLFDGEEPLRALTV